METEWTSAGTPASQDPKLDAETLAAVRALQGGETQESTRHLFETFEPELAAYFRRHGCQDHEADDLAQTVFMQMLEQIGTLNDAASFHFWLFRIARNYLRNFMRDRARSREGVEDFTDAVRRDSEPSAFWIRGTFEPNPEAKLTLRETVDRRRLILGRLLQVSKLAERTCQSLVRRLHGDSYEEIARDLEIPVGTVGSHVSRASAALLRNLEKIDLDGVIPLEDGDDPVAGLSAELLTFKREALEADPAYFRACTLEAASARHEEAEESDDEALMLRAEDVHEDDEDEIAVVRAVDSPAAIAAVVKEDRARGRSRRRVTRTIPPAGRQAKEPDLGHLDRDALGYPAILLREAAAFLGDGHAHAGVGGDLFSDLALKAKLTCAGSLLARGRRFKVARQVEEIARQAVLLIGAGRYDEIRHRVAEGCVLLRSFLDGPQIGGPQKGGGAQLPFESVLSTTTTHETSRRPEPCQQSRPTPRSTRRYASAR